MAISPMKIAAKAVGYTVAAAGILILIGLFIVGVLLLSLIPIYLSDTSVEGYGEVYAIPGFTIKAIYTNVTANFTGGNVLSLSDLSNICTAIFRAKNVKDFYACVASNFTAYGPTGNIDGTSFMQRRAINDVALYEIGDMYLLFSSSCSGKRTLGQWSTNISSAANNTCYARRSAACRAFITTPNPGSNGNQWSPFPSGYTQLVITNTTSCAAIAITSIFNIYYFNYATIYGRFFNGTRTPDNPGDCKYIASQPQWYLRSLVSNLTGYNTSTCSNVIG